MPEIVATSNALGGIRVWHVTTGALLMHKQVVLHYDAGVEQLLDAVQPQATVATIHGRRQESMQVLQQELRRIDAVRRAQAVAGAGRADRSARLAAASGALIASDSSEARVREAATVAYEKATQFAGAMAQLRRGGITSGDLAPTPASVGVRHLCWSSDGLQLASCDDYARLAVYSPPGVQSVRADAIISLPPSDGYGALKKLWELLRAREELRRGSMKVAGRSTSSRDFGAVEPLGLVPVSDEEQDDEIDLDLDDVPMLRLVMRGGLPPFDQTLQLEDEQLEIDHLYEQQERATQVPSEQQLLSPLQLRGRRRAYPIEYRARAVRDMPGLWARKRGPSASLNRLLA